jgi:hypothetical protein
MIITALEENLTLKDKVGLLRRLARRGLRLIY